jgi:hypothetical protein
MPNDTNVSSTLALLGKIADRLSLPNPGLSEAELAASIDQYYQAKPMIQVEPLVPLESLPDTVLRIILKDLQSQDKANLRMVSKWLSEKIRCLDASFRKLRIGIYEYEVFSVITTLNNITKKQEDTYKKYELDVLLLHDIDPSPDVSERKYLFNLLFQDWGEFIIKLEFIIFGDEEYLLDPTFTFPNLTKLQIREYIPCDFYDFELGMCPCDIVTFFNRYSLDHHTDLTVLEHSQGSAIRTSFIERHAYTLHTLQIWGNWDLDLKRPLASLEYLKLQKSAESVLNSFVEVCGVLLSQLSISSTSNQFSQIDSTFPVVQEITLDSCDKSWFRLITQHASQLTNLCLKEVFFIDFTEEPCPELPSLKVLYTEELLSINGNILNHLLAKCRLTLECLMVDSLDKSDAIQMARLKDLYIRKRTGGETEESLGPWLELNSSTLEFLFVNMNKTSFYYDTDIEYVQSSFLNLKTILLPGCINSSLIDLCSGKTSGSPYRADVYILKHKVNQVLARRPMGDPYYKNFEAFISDDIEMR